MTLIYETQGIEKFSEVNKEIVLKKVEELGFTSIQEVSESLKEVAKRNNYIRSLLNSKSWEKWSESQISYITPKLLEKEPFVTKYLLEGQVQPIGIIEDESYGDPYKYIDYFGDCKHLQLELAEITQKDQNTKIVLYKYKYLKIERLEIKLSLGEELSQDEIKYLFNSSEEKERETLKDGWVLSKIEFNGNTYEVKWKK